MLGNDNRWEKLGRIVTPGSGVPWLVSHAAAAFALPLEGGGSFDVYVTGRDADNRSHIGKVRLDLDRDAPVVAIDDGPVLSPGELGTFDENGVSYPSIVHGHDGHAYMFYVGWMPTVLTGFQNDVGLVRAPQGTDAWTRVSRAPILPRTNEEPFGTGSAYAIEDDGSYRLWYTAFVRWGKPGEHRHYYVIREARSDDCLTWRRTGHTCIDIAGPDEYAIGRPSVLKLGDTYHMWYVHRGAQYRIGYAHSADGSDFTRRDDLAAIDVGPEAWDSDAICYPHVFRSGDALYMLYCGNEYGRGGLGLARLALG